jgi:hypothetical protein
MRQPAFEAVPTGALLATPPLVLDLAVLLSPYGLWLTRRLALAGQVWLPSVLSTLLEETADDEAGLVQRLGACLGQGDPGPLERGLAGWRRAWPEITQTPRIYWFSDSLDTSRARKGLSPASLDRLDELKQGLAARAGDGDPSRLEIADPLLDAGGDALALAAALATERALVVSAPLAGKLEPAICAALDRYRIPCQQLEPGRHRELLLAAVLPALHAAQVLGLLATGSLRLALVHLVAPEAARPLPPARPAAGGALVEDEPDESVFRLLETSEDELSLWEGAMALWHDVTWQ